MEAIVQLRPPASGSDDPGDPRSYDYVSRFAMAGASLRSIRSRLISLSGQHLASARCSSLLSYIVKQLSIASSRASPPASGAWKGFQVTVDEIQCTGPKTGSGGCRRGVDVDDNRGTMKWIHADLWCRRAQQLAA